MPACKLTGLRVVVLDLDDTLYPEWTFAFSGFRAVSDWLRAQMECPFDPAGRMRELFREGDRRHVFDQVLSELGISDQAEWLEKMIHCYRHHTPRIALAPDAEEALRCWKGWFKLGLISDGPLAMQQHKVDALDLSRYLDRAILTGQWGEAYWKPHPRAFQEIESTWGCSGPECLYVADNVKKDFVAPVKLGWRTIRMARPAGIYADATPPPGGEPEFTISSFRECDLSS
jgi:putative hydrolase of the HAD superfamily